MVTAGDGGVVMAGRELTMVVVDGHGDLSYTADGYVVPIEYIFGTAVWCNGYITGIKFISPGVRTLLLSYF